MERGEKHKIEGSYDLCQTNMRWRKNIITDRMLVNLGEDTQCISVICLKMVVILV